MEASMHPHQKANCSFGPGRPTGYSVDRGAELIGLMATGLSISAAAAAMGFHRDTIYEWADRHPEFSDALKRGRGVRVLRLEREMLAGESGPYVTARIFALKNACPEEWREKTEIKHDAPSGLGGLLAGLNVRVIEPQEYPE
jgi:hypothetical protein